MLQPSPRDKSCHPACLQRLLPDFPPSYRTIPSIYGWDETFLSFQAWVCPISFSRNLSCSPRLHSLPFLPCLTTDDVDPPGHKAGLTLQSLHCPLLSLTAVECLFWREHIIFAFFFCSCFFLLLGKDLYTSFRGFDTLLPTFSKLKHFIQPIFLKTRKREQGRRQGHVLFQTSAVSQGEHLDARVFANLKNEGPGNKSGQLRETLLLLIWPKPDHQGQSSLFTKASVKPPCFG